MPLTPRQNQTLLWSAVAAVLAIVVLTLGPVLTPFIMAAIMAYILEPGVRWMDKHRVPRSVAVSLMVSMAILAVLLTLLILVPIVQQEFSVIRDRLPGLITTITERLLPWINQKFGIQIRLDTSSVRGWISTNLAGFGDDVAAQLFAYAKSGWGAALQIVSLLLLVPVVAFFLLLDWDHMMDEIKSLIPIRWREDSFDLIGEVDKLLGQYLRGQLKVITILAVFYSIGLAIAGFELWLPIGILSGLLIAIPYLGFVLSVLFALIDGMLQLGPLQGLLAVGILYGIGQIFESIYLTPRLVGEQIGLHPVAVIFALLAFGSVFGFVGVLLALPLAAILAVALRRVRSAFRASEFYNRDAAQSDDK